MRILGSIQAGRGGGTEIAEGCPYAELAAPASPVAMSTSSSFAVGSTADTVGRGGGGGGGGGGAALSHSRNGLTSSSESSQSIANCNVHT